MKTINRIGIGIGVMLLFGACTKDNFIETGLSNGRFHGSILEYLEAPNEICDYNWDSTALLIRQAGPEMVRLFEGKDPAHPEITFLGPTNHSIRRYMLEEGITSIREMDPEECKAFLLPLIIDGKFFRKDVPDGKVGDNGEPESGGQYYTTFAGHVLWVYAFTEQVQGVADIGNKKLTVYSRETMRSWDIASADIEPDNGVVHSLHYGYTLGDFE